MKKKNQWTIRNIETNKVSSFKVGANVSKKLHSRFTNFIKNGLTVLISVFVIYGVVQAGSITPPSGSGEPAAKFYTLSEIYEFIANNTAATEGVHDFTFSDSLAGTHHTLTEIYDTLANLISANQVKLGTTYLGVDGALVPDEGNAETGNVCNNNTFFGSSQADWNLQTGTLNPTASAIISGNTYCGVAGTAVATPTYGDNDASKVLTIAGNSGTYDAANLSAENVRNAIAFGVGQTGTFTGSLAYGDDNAENVLTIAATPGTYNISNLSNSVIKSGTTWGVGLGSTGTLTPDGGTAIVADLFNGKTAHLTADWNLDTGTLDLACNTASFDGAGNIVTDAYDGAGNGTNRWCITGSGDATTSDILSGKIAWVDGVAITGAMANIGSFGLTCGVSDQAVTSGYYSGGTLTGDADLAAANIAADIDIFGVSGTLLKNLFNGTDRTDQLSAVTLNAGGSGYTTGAQVLTITQSGASVGTVNVTVDGTGVVTSVDSIATTGKGYSVADNLATTDGGGTGATVNITAVASHYPGGGGVDGVGGVDDYNNGGTMPSDSYTSTWTTCVSPDYCGTDSNADKKDDSTGLVWSDRIGTSNWFAANNCKYPNGLLGDDGVCNVNGEIACKCVKHTGATGDEKTGCELLGSGWRLPSQKELMQAYINGSWGNLSSAGYRFWSATTRSNYTPYAWYTRLTHGGTYGTTKTTTTISVRCVR